MPIDPLYSSRLKAFQEEAQDLYYKMSDKKEEIKVEIDPELNSPAGAFASTKTISVNPVFLLEKGDIPKLVREHDLETGKLRLWERLIGRIRVQFRTNVPLLKTLVAKKFETDPEKFNNFSNLLAYQLDYWATADFAAIRRFVIAHEVAHIFHEHRYGKWSSWCSALTTCLIGLYLFSTLHLFIATALTLIVSIVGAKGLRCLRDYMERYQEKEADLSAISVTKDFKSAEQFFKIHKLAKDEHWAKLSWINKVYAAITSPEIVFHLTHPSSQERIDYLRAASRA